jgi:transcription initiation factor TFIID subunit TAF12
VVGEIADGDVGGAALAGAVVGGSRERRQRRQADQQAQAQAQQQQAEAMNARKQGEEAYFRARAACLEGRGYSVK